MSLSFIHDLNFIALSSSVKEVVKTLEKVAQEVIKRYKQNVITYNTSKAEAILFF